MTSALAVALLALAAPRASIVEAMPPSTSEALFVEPMARIEPAMSGLSAVLGDGFALSFAEMAALPNLVLQGQARNDVRSLGLDPDGGLGIFHVDGYPGAVGVVAVSDELRAMNALMQKMRTDGAELLLGSSHDGVEARIPTQPPMLAFCHRGSLYLAMPDDDSGRQASLALSEAIQEAPPTGLAGTPLWARLAERLDRAGAVVFFRKRPLAQAPELLGLALAIRPGAERLAVNGFAATARPLAAGAPLTARDLARHAPGTPAIVLSSHVGPAIVRALLLGDASAAGQAMLPPWLDLGKDAAELAAGLGGGLDALAYTRASVATSEAAQDGAALWEASIQDQAQVTAALQHRARQRRGGRDASPWRLRVRPSTLSAAVGPAPSGPPSDVLRKLSTRFGGGAFGAGHLSLYVDLPLLREGFLDEDGVAPPLLPRGQYLFLDAGVVEGGLSVRGELLLLAPDDASGAAR